jgi:hypothetical protein
MAEFLRGMAYRDSDRRLRAQRALDDLWGAGPTPEPVKAKTFDEWLAETSALLEECAERKK